MTLNANGTGRYTTSYYAHGDALHVGDLVPSRPGPGDLDDPRAELRQRGQPARREHRRAHHRRKTTPATARARAAAWPATSTPATRARSSGAPARASPTCSTPAAASVGRTPGSSNFLVWWDADPVRELLDQNHVDKYGTGGDTRLLTADGASSINGTKATPNLSGDIFGDWREEVILRSNDNRVPAHLHHDRPGHQPHLHAAPRRPVPGRAGLAEHRLQPAAPPELLHRQRDEHPAHAEHHVPRRPRLRRRRPAT